MWAQLEAQLEEFIRVINALEDKCCYRHIIDIAFLLSFARYARLLIY